MCYPVVVLDATAPSPTTPERIWEIFQNNSSLAIPTTPPKPCNQNHRPLTLTQAGASTELEDYQGSWAGADAAEGLLNELQPEHCGGIQGDVSLGQQSKALIQRLLERMVQQHQDGLRQGVRPPLSLPGYGQYIHFRVWEVKIGWLGLL